MPPPKIILGTSVWGERWTREEEKQLPPILKELGIRQVDTAPTYPLSNPGKAEKLIGEIGLGPRLRLLIDSKVSCVGNGYGTLKAENITKSLDQTLENVALDKLHILYIHAPDTKTPLAEQVAAIDAEYRKNRFAKLGVCNFPPDLLSEWLRLAESNGYVKPTVYQGHYNLLHRTYEKEIFPLLRKHDITFIAHSPLAGGFLTSKLTFATSPKDLIGTRFEAKSTNALGNAFRSCYDKPSMHTAVRQMKMLCENHGVEMAEAAMRWILYHSKLEGGPLLGDTGDAVVVGPHGLAHLRAYAEAYMRGPLEEELVKGLEALWERVEGDVEVIGAL